MFSLRSLLRPLPTPRLIPTPIHHHVPLPTAAPFHSTPHPSNKKTISRKQMPSRPKPPPESEIEESFLKGSGPGGQKINKTNSAVQIKHIPTNIVIKCQETRSRSQNRKIARDILAARLDELYNGAQSRTAVVGSAKKKRADSAAKKARRKHRKIAEEKAKAAGSTGIASTEEAQEIEEEEWEVTDEEYHEDQLKETEGQAKSETETVGGSSDRLKELHIDEQVVEIRQPTTGNS